MKKLTILLSLLLSACLIEITNDSSNSPTEEPIVIPPFTPGSFVAIRSTITPQLSPINDQAVDHTQGEDLSVDPQVTNISLLDGNLHWVKDYGPDDVNVHPLTGQVTWDIPNDMPSESFHIGLKASSLTETIRLSFIVHAGVSQVLTVGSGGDYANIGDGLDNLSSGGTLIVLNGTYTGEDNFMGLTGGGSIQQPESGTESSYTTVMAQQPGMVILKDGAYIRFRGKIGELPPIAYVAVKGFYVIDKDIAVYGQYEGNDIIPQYTPHHIKFIRNGVEGGDSAQSPFSASKSKDILFENNYVMGGGRYKFTSFHGENIVFRRNVARYDRGPVHNEPKGTYSIYSTMNAFIGNNLAIDADSSKFLVRGEIAGEFATPTTSGPTRAKFQRNMQVNSVFMFGNMDNQESNGGGDSDVEHSDVVSWDVRPYQKYVYTWGSAWFDHMTMGEIQKRKLDSTIPFFFSFKDKTRGLTNSILHNFNTSDVMFDNFKKETEHTAIDRVVERFGVDTVNLTSIESGLGESNSSILNTTAEDPLQSDLNPNGSLRYLTRIEPNTSLSGAAQDGSNLGATVMTHVGQSGTHYNQVGYDVETNLPMWPFPMEDMIKQKFSEYTYTGPTYEGPEGGSSSRVPTGIDETLIGARGFAVDGQTLTNYIWGYLGNLVPPFSLTGVAASDAILLQWERAAEVTQTTITGYRIYGFSTATEEKLLLAEISSDKLSYKIDNLQRTSRYSFIVTALKGSEESGYSYPVTVDTL